MLCDGVYLGIKHDRTNIQKFRMIHSIDYKNTSRHSSGSEDNSALSPTIIKKNVYDFLARCNPTSGQSIKLSDIFYPRSTTFMTEIHVWSFVNQIISCLEFILREYEFQTNDEKLILTEIKFIDDILIFKDGNIDPKTFQPKNHENNLHITDPGAINKIIHSIGLIFYDFFTTCVLESTKKFGLLETDFGVDHDQILTKQHPLDREDCELDLDDELESLFLTMLENGSESPVSDKDEGYGRESPVHCVQKSMRLILVKQKCSRYFDRKVHELQSSKDKSKFCTILRRICTEDKLNTITSDEYYRAVCCEMVDEYHKLNNLLTQLNESQKNENNNHTNHISAYDNDNNSLVSTNDTKIWLDSWNKVMKQLRFGASLKPASERELKDCLDNSLIEDDAKPFNKLMADIRQLDHSKLRSAKHDKFDSKRFTQAELKRASSVPALSDYRLSLTKSAIQKRLKELKPVSERTLADPPVVEKCLHECLMDSIRATNSSQLRRTQTIVKPDIYLLYLEEKNYDNLKRSKSMRQLSSLNHIYSNETNVKLKKRKSLKNSVQLDMFDMDFSSTNSALNLTSTPKHSLLNQSSTNLRRFRSVNFGLKHKKEQNLQNNKISKNDNSLYDSFNCSETILRSPINYQLDNASKSTDNFLRRSFMRKSKKHSTDVWRYSTNNDPFETMKRTVDFSRPKVSKLSFTSLIHKWIYGDSSYNNDKKYKHD